MVAEQALDIQALKAVTAKNWYGPNGKTSPPCVYQMTITYSSWDRNCTALKDGVDCRCEHASFKKEGKRTQ
jgi:hypothetical protein